MYILGIDCFYHDAAACLLKDGKIVAAAEEERFTRRKHDINFPINAIKFCLRQANITVDDLEFVTFYEKPLIKFERILNSNIEMFPFSFPVFYKAMPSWLNEKLKLKSIIRKKMKYNGEVLFVDHHLAHAASCFLISPFKKSAILTIDGVGEWATTSLGFGEGNNITLFEQIKFPHSIGLLYSAVTEYLGFKVNNDEYKVMGLAALGEPTYYDDFKKIIHINEDGSYSLDMSYFIYHYKLSMVSKKFIKQFGPKRIPESDLEKRHIDIAATLQKITEDAMFKMLNHLYEQTKCKNLCMAGGVALNCVVNGKIRKHTPFKEIFIQPAASDAGAGMGSAFFIYNTVLDRKREFTMENAYLGPGFSRDHIKNFLTKNKINFTEFKDDSELLRKTAKLIFDNKIIGFFQGRMEWGPRALGNRSILANPCNPQMKDILNDKVKHREDFRPFAPVTTIEDFKKYFESDHGDTFMLFVYPIKKDKQRTIPSVTHVDGTGRIQTVSREQNKRYYQVIKEFEKLSGVPVLINTSFNIRGEPIVCTPEDAYRCMMGTGIDYLVMENFLIGRADNPKDMWDSWKGRREILIKMG